MISNIFVTCFILKHILRYFFKLLGNLSTVPWKFKYQINMIGMFKKLNKINMNPLTCFNIRGERDSFITALTTGNKTQTATFGQPLIIATVYTPSWKQNRIALVSAIRRIEGKVNEGTVRLIINQSFLQVKLQFLYLRFVLMAIRLSEIAGLA